VIKLFILVSFLFIGFGAAQAAPVGTTAKHKLACDEIIQVKIKALVNGRWRNQHVKEMVKQAFPWCTDATEPPPPPPGCDNPPCDSPPPPIVAGIAPPMSTAPSARLTFMNQQYTGWYADSNYNDLNTWLYDRVQVLYELYLRTGDESVHAEATKSAKEYVKHYTNVGSDPDYSDCNPGWSYAGVDRCDVKYTYASACWYLLKVDGVDACSKDLLGRLHRYLMSYGWNAARLLDPDSADVFNFEVTERNMGYQFIGLIYVNKVAREQGYTDLAATTGSDIRAVIKWLYDWQAKYAYGGWMHSFNGHEGDDANPDYLIFSPWQSSILAGALWRAWDAGFTTDTCGTKKCVPDMMVKLAQGMEDYGWVKNPTDWMTGANVSGQISWYLAFPLNPGKQKTYQDSEGWYADEHNPELQCVAALGYYFSKDAAQKATFKARYDALEKYYVPALSERGNPNRKFGWQHSHNPSCEWLMESH
jgi:hypothetical protein